MKRSMIRKSLESDEPIFMIGYEQEFKPQGNGLDVVDILNNNVTSLHEIDKLRFEKKHEMAQHIDNISAFDHEEELEQKKEIIELKDSEQKGILELSPYFARLFPACRLQKPGHDLYGVSTLVLGVIWIYSFFFFDYMTVNEFQLLEGAKKSSNLFKTSMSQQLVFVFVIIIIERYVNRSDTKKIEQNMENIDQDG